MKIHGVLLDKDGTLFDYHQTWMPLNRLAAKIAARGDDTVAHNLLQTGGWDPETNLVKSGSLIAAASNQEIAEAWGSQVGGWDINELAEKITGLFTREGVHSAVPVTNLPSLFQRLRADAYRLGVATSDSESSARAMLEKFGAAEFLDFISGYDSGFGTKPMPGMVHGFCDACGLTPDRTIMVGDNRHDVETGRNAGCAFTVGVLTGTSLQKDLIDVADHVIDSVADLPDLLNRLSP